MANPAAEARAKVLAAHPEAVVAGRGRNTLRHRLADAPEGRQRYALDAFIGPIHYGPGEDQEIDTALVPSVAPWSWEMTKADFEVRALSRLDAGQVIEYRDGEEWVRFQPMALQYSNALDQVQPIAMPGKVDAGVDDDTLTWANGYGKGIDISWQAQTARLAKRLTIQSPDALPPVEQYILNGGEPCLEINFIFAYSGGVTPWINGEPWDGKKQAETQALVEFRDGGGEVLWWFNLPRSWDAEGEGQLGTFRFKKAGNSLYVSHRVPLAFVQAAPYPLTVDVDIDKQVGGSTDDANENDAGNMALINASIAMGSYGTPSLRDAGFRFTGISGLSGATIGAAKLTFHSTAADTGDFEGDFYAHDAEAPGTFTEDANNITDTAQRPRTTATCEADGTDFGDWADETDYDFVGDGVNGIKDIVQELATSYDPSAIALLFIYTSGTGERLAYAWDDDTAKAAKLHIEYTAGAAEIEVTPSPVVIPLVAPAPSVGGTGTAEVTPSALAMPLTLPVPTVGGVGTAGVAPSPVAMPLVLPAPSVTAPGTAGVAPSPVAILLVLPTPTIEIIGFIEVTPSPVAISLVAPAPTVGGIGVAEVTPSAVAMPLTLPTPAVSGVGVTEIAPSPVVIVLVLPTPTVVVIGIAIIGRVNLEGEFVTTIALAGEFVTAIALSGESRPTEALAGQFVTAIALKGSVP